MKTFTCGAVVAGCTASFSAETEEEILEQVAVHARGEHGMTGVPDEVISQVRSNIR